jgi:chitodextrinase
MKKMLLTFGIGLMICSCNADDELMQNAAQTDPSATVADFKLANPDEIIKEGSYLNLINTSQNAKSYLWDLGDGTTSTEATPHYLYPKCGSYNVKLTVTDLSGNQTSVEKVVDVFCTVPRHHANPMIYSRI